LNCLICNKATISFTVKNTNITYYQCNFCEFICKSKEYYQDLNSQKKRYDLHQNHENDLGYIEYFQRFLRFFLPHIENIEFALDFGCGRTSLLAKLLKQKRISCDYYDPIYYPKNLKDGKTYDLIVSTEVFEHLHDPKEVFENLIHRLNMGGYLAIQTEFHSNNIESFNTWWYANDTTHIVFFTSKTFEVMCKLYGCSLILNNNKNIVLIRKIT